MYVGLTVRFKRHFTTMSVKCASSAKYRS